jgi:hypothetical protein
MARDFIRCLPGKLDGYGLLWLQLSNAESVLSLIIRAGDKEELNTGF